MPIATLILAAGQGTRMKSDLPKVLHRLAGAPLLQHVMQTGAAIGATRSVLVVGHGAESVADIARDIDPEITIVEQAQQKGTGHAVEQARPALEAFQGDVIVLYGDTPLIRPETLAAMRKARSGHDIVVLGFEAANPGRYGRLIVDGDGTLEAIVEARDASPEELQLRLCNSGVICTSSALLFELVARLGNDNASGEYYLTDIIALARARGLSSGVVICDEAETMGINSRAELAAAEAAFQARARAELLAAGVTMTAPETVFLAHDTVIGRDVVIGPNVVFGPGVTVETGAEIRAFCHLEGCHISQGAIIGPFARLRPGAEIGNDAHVGNFVEIKNAILGEGAKANHLSYIGDADVGDGANIGAGTITCNYDGVMKHRTRIGRHAFIGSNTALVAPISVGDEAVTGSGSVITRDVPDGALALERSQQVTREGLARKHMARLRAIKAKKLKTEN
ncbi:MAG: bifunctional UDP-N-acetylglucosamine diphosphorylase/glucosamine-1-phosphate N-acetyltransferase GlmU [Paracoccaceae bacterium]|nr:bifunctional UDP-N-acetylglucosamine diphosphorylase/glucosamine-1-phosphate N-acetyltransferase GlmU [Paracoccaceae bacterium]